MDGDGEGGVDEFYEKRTGIPETSVGSTKPKYLTASEMLRHEAEVEAEFRERLLKPLLENVEITHGEEIPYSELPDVLKDLKVDKYMITDHYYSGPPTPEEIELMKKHLDGLAGLDGMVTIMFAQHFDFNK
jgi:hypothetical protein